MSSPDVDDDVLKNSASVEVTGQIMVIAIIVLFFVVVFILFLHLYAKWFWWRIEQHPRDPNSSSVRRPGGRRRRFVFAPGQDPAAALRAGLNPAILKKIPVVGFSQQEFKDGLECAVCLCELEDGEKARLLPKCNHGFHVECIDMWFQSHSTCPLCRNPVNIVDDDDKSSVEIDMQSTQESSATDSSTNFPTNVLFWGDDTQVSSASAAACLQEVVSTSSYSLSSSSATSSSTETSSNSRRSGGPEMVIEIPPSTVSQHLSSLSPEEESKTPVATRLRSLKRLLSRE